MMPDSIIQICSITSNQDGGRRIRYHKRSKPHLRQRPISINLHGIIWLPRPVISRKHRGACCRGGLEPCAHREIRRRQIHSRNRHIAISRKRSTSRADDSVIHNRRSPQGSPMPTISRRINHSGTANGPLQIIQMPKPDKEGTDGTIQVDSARRRKWS